jgi:hypothetical protein
MKMIIAALTLTLMLASCNPPLDTSLPTSPSPEPASQPEGCISSQDDAYLQQRLNMVATTIENRGVEDPAVLKAMRCTLRHEFVP